MSSQLSLPHPHPHPLQGFLAPDKVDPKLLDPKYIFSEVDTDEPQKAPSLQELEVGRTTV